MIKKVLVANRGEIAVRIIRALKELKIPSVAVYSTADRQALHTQLADEAICIGPPASLNSYQDPIAILSAAMVTGCQAIHPGYGFLSESASFAKLCEEIGLTFIGPSSHLISRMGDKQVARETMASLGLPIIPGSPGLVADPEEGQTLADDLGYPVMIKAVDGGGGRGMRKVDAPEDFQALFKEAMAETQAVYGNQKLYLEKVIEPARHIEVQLLGDSQGQVIHLGERDCSIQRKHQKVLEFAPAWGLDPDLRQDICQAAQMAGEKLGYEGAGTIEFLVNPAGDFYFMEMNTRLQVEHPVTEAITGIDLVKEQVRIAQGLPLSLSQEEVTWSGVAIECRLNAEDPYQNFMPSSGLIQQALLPSGGLGLRVETGIYSGVDLPPFYDSMIAKVITHGSDPEEAVTLMQRALQEVSIQGVTSNIELLEALMEDPAIQSQNFDLHWFEKYFMPSFA